MDGDKDSAQLRRGVQQAVTLRGCAIAQLRNMRQRESDAEEFLSSVVLGKIVENRKPDP